MKIKKIFGLASIASLAILMSACGKTKKNETFLNKDYFSLLDQEKAEYQEENASKKNVVKVFENEEVSSYSNSIYITEDSSNYYIYNLELKEKKILTLEKTGIYDIEINSTQNIITVQYEKNANNNYGYELYLFNGKKVIEKTYSPYGISFSSQGKKTYYVSVFERIEVYQYVANYSDEENYAHITSYYVVNHKTANSKINIGNTTVKDYYLADEYSELYGNAESFDADGKLYGLKGYTVRKEDNEYTIFKNGKYVNKVQLSEGTDFLVSNGYALVQTSNLVTINDDYDYCFQGSYYKVKTYRMDLLTSKMTELKTFHYAFKILSTVYNDGVIESYVCQAVDFKAHKQVTSNDFRMALINGKGRVETNESVNFSSNCLLSEDGKYYSYLLSDDHTSYDETTVVYNKKGEVIGAYDGIYYEDVLVNTNNGTATFTDKDGNVKAVLNNYTRLSLDRYVGTDIMGIRSLVEVKDGDVFLVNVIDYYSVYSEVYTKSNGTDIEFYTLDSTLTKIEYSYALSDSFSYINTYNGTKYFKCTNSSGETTLVYFE